MAFELTIVYSIKQDRMNIPLIFLSLSLLSSKIETLLDALEFLILPSTKVLPAIEMQTAKKPRITSHLRSLESIGPKHRQICITLVRT